MQDREILPPECFYVLLPFPLEHLAFCDRLRTVLQVRGGNEGGESFLSLVCGFLGVLRGQEKGTAEGISAG